MAAKLKENLPTEPTTGLRLNSQLPRPPEALSPRLICHKVKMAEKIDSSDWKLNISKLETPFKAMPIPSID
jgi:hypothetical protein